jgi:hypothetical protein
VKGFELWLNMSRGTQGKSVMSRMPHKMIKGQEWIMMRYESRWSHEGLRIDEDKIYA